MSDLFICHTATGLGYSDRSREIHGDYAPVGWLFWRDLTFQPAKGANRELLAEARRHAATCQSRRGEVERVSTSGQTTILGYGLDSP